ncbi:MAG TPA: hypothetical protein VFF73_00540, partial [Planctomycetota bacterium]|nr:hypothetical protein [Planctomycetota bacterium]
PTRVMEVFAPPPTADLFAISEEQAERTIAVEAPMALIGARCDGCRVPIPPTTTPDARGTRFCPECAAKLS